jgi:hypothetical protein
MTDHSAHFLGWMHVLVVDLDEHVGVGLDGPVLERLLELVGNAKLFSLQFITVNSDWEFTGSELDDDCF